MNSRRGADAASAGFDRLRPRSAQPPPATLERSVTPITVGRDVHGKRVLYSGVRPVGPVASGLDVLCSRCGQTTTIRPRGAVALLTPSVHVPLPRLRYRSLLRCPACQRITWVRIRLRVRASSRS
ncbi:hypothetical protein [Candidatus Protofrankia californiensis]|uniref:hypothetical protein n=1 Tax=Candidatus Protofrankia californiensis TaxID=1839754 RepID=UPI001F497E56|nr:hypothetical protein [Candidatus Protofrankia californiensis]